MRQYFFFLSTLLRSRERVALELCSCKSLALCSTLIAFRRTGHGFFKLSWRSAQSQRICAHLQDSAPYMAMSLALRTHTLTHKREIRHNQITRPRHCKDIHHHHSYHSHHPSPPSLCDSSDSDLCPHTKPKATTFPGDRWQTPRMFFFEYRPGRCSPRTYLFFLPHNICASLYLLLAGGLSPNADTLIEPHPMH